MKTAESVTEGHPDKVCDQISDAILDAYLTRDSNARVAAEAFGSHGLVVIGGEITANCPDVDVERLVQSLYKEIGYTDEIEILVHLTKQSPDIAQGVDTGGAGDQGIMYGYATSETPELLPKSVVLAHALTKRLADLRKHDPDFDWLRPDGKSQVTMEQGKVHSVLVSTQHAPDMEQDDIELALRRSLIEPIVGDLSEIEVLVNPTGRFVLGGFTADAGLTGRKIMVDTYGGLLPHGGGAFSGKDPTKVDRSAAYMCRFAAKNLVANGYAKNAFVSVAYAIGRSEPMMLQAKSGDGNDISDIIRKKFDFRPQAIIERLDLRRPIYLPTATYGHFGRNEFPWEQIVSI